MHTPRRRAFSQLKTALLCPGSLTKTIEESLVRVYASSSVRSCTTRVANTLASCLVKVYRLLETHLLAHSDHGISCTAMAMACER